MSIILQLFIFYSVLLPISLVKKSINSQRLRSLIKKGQGGGWRRSNWDTTDKNSYVVVSTHQMNEHTHFSSRPLFKTLKSKDRVWLFFIYRVLNSLPDMKDEQEENTLPTDRYVLF